MLLRFFFCLGYFLTSSFIVTDGIEFGVNIFTSMLSGVPGSVNREPLESSRLTTWPLSTGRPEGRNIYTGGLHTDGIYWRTAVPLSNMSSHLSL